MATVIETRYRDIPWEEARKCQPSIDGRDFWNRMRGMPVRIQTPPFFRDENDQSGVVCKEPNYKVVGKYLAACAHIAEIGD